jgi:hypothetical protein
MTFPPKKAEMEYCSGIFADEDEVILTDGKVERDAKVENVNKGIASFEMSGEPRPVRQVFFIASK